MEGNVKNISKSCFRGFDLLMILVLLGTQANSFHRLLEEIDNQIQKGNIKEEVIVQAGFTKYVSKNMTIFDLVSTEDIKKYQENARVIITHGGVGSIISSLKMGKRVIAVPRLKQYEEHVNDHQKQIVKTFTDEGYIKGIMDVSELEKALQEVEKFKPKKYESKTEHIIQVISDFIEKN